MRGAPVVTLRIGVVGGGLTAFAVAVSGSPSEDLVRGRSGAFGTYWGESAPLPQARSSS